MNFSDFFVRPNYSANLTDVAGKCRRCRRTRRATSRLGARRPHGAGRGAGPHQSVREGAVARHRGKARDVDLPPLTPYSAKYAGYGIEKGKLTFDVRYRVENRKLAAENRLVLDQLTFGPRVESPTATKLPVLLAVALLKDSRGVIDIRLPISGSLDDPKFSVGGLIVRVIVNLIAQGGDRAVRAAGAAFGGGEELSTLAFAAGSASARRRRAEAHRHARQGARRPPRAQARHQAGAPTRRPTARRCAAPPSRPRCVARR